MTCDTYMYKHVGNMMMRVLCWGFWCVFPVGIFKPDLYHLSTSTLLAVAECKPALDDKVLSDLVEQLNSSDELSVFCKALREQFCQLVP